MIDWTAVLSDTLSGIIAGLVLAILGYLFLDKYTRNIAFAQKMSDRGFDNVSLERQSAKEVDSMCRKADVIKIINVSGFHFLNQNRRQITNALKRGCEIRFLCALPDSLFLSDIEKMETSVFDASGKPLRKHGTKISDEVNELTSEYSQLGMTIRYYSSQYRLPFIIAHYPDETIKVWLTMTLPPYKSTKSFVLRGKLENETVYSNDVNFVEMMEANFDTIWDYGSMSLDEYNLKKQNPSESATKENDG